MKHTIDLSKTKIGILWGYIILRQGLTLHFIFDQDNNAPGGTNQEVESNNTHDKSTTSRISYDGNMKDKDGVNNLTHSNNSKWSYLKGGDGVLQVSRPPANIDVIYGIVINEDDLTTDTSQSMTIKT